MNLRERIAAMLGHPPPDQPDLVKLDQAEGRMASRLSKLTGKRRDEVLAEAYRRADKILAERR